MPRIDIEKFHEELTAELARHNVSDIDHANVVLAEFNKRRNNAPLDDFMGLSSHQMFRMMNFKLSSPDVLTFTSVLPTDQRH